MKRPCIDCGALTERTRCVRCRSLLLEAQRPERRAYERTRNRPSPSARGYGSAWRRLSAEVRAGQPWCSSCGSTDDLTVDHVVPGSLAGGLRVLCRRCHGAIGARTDRAARG